MTQTETLTERCYEAGLKVERIVHLATMAPDDLEEELFEFIEANRDAVAAEAGFEWYQPTAEDTAGQTDREVDREMAEWFQGELAMNGVDLWLLEVLTPVRKPHPTTYSQSWGHCHLTVVVGATYDAALDKAFAWCDDQKRRDLGPDHPMAPAASENAKSERAGVPTASREGQ